MTYPNLAAATAEIDAIIRNETGYHQITRAEVADILTEIAETLFALATAAASPLSVTDGSTTVANLRSLSIASKLLLSMPVAGTARISHSIGEVLLLDREPLVGDGVDNDIVLQDSGDIWYKIGGQWIKRTRFALAGAPVSVPGVAPTFSLVGPAVPVNGAFNVTVYASQPVTGLANTDFVVTNGTAGTLVEIEAGLRWTLPVTPTSGVQLVTVGLPSGVCQSTGASPVGNLPAGPLLAIIDTVAPTPVITGPTHVKTSFTATIQFGEPVTGLIAGDFTLVNCSVVVTVASATSYTLAVTPTGNVSITLPAAKVIDAAGNDNVLSNTLSVVYDITAPTATITNQTFNLDDAGEYFYVDITFSEAVTDLLPASVTATNTAGTATSVARLSAAAFRAKITPTATGPCTLAVVAAAVADLAGNASQAATAVTLQWDVAPLTGTISSPTVISPGVFDFTVTLNKALQNMAAERFVVVGGTTTSVTPGTPATSYTVRITAATADTPIFLALPAGSVRDIYGLTLSHTLNAAVSATLSPASVSIGPLLRRAGIGRRYDATITTGRPLAGFIAGEFGVVNATVASISLASSTPLNWDLSISADVVGSGSVQLGANTGVDQTGVLSAASNTRTFVCNDQHPRCTVYSKNGGRLAVATAEFSVEFSETVTGFTPASISASYTPNAGGLTPVPAEDITIVAVSGSVYTVTFPFASTSPGNVTFQVDAAAGRNTDSNPSDRSNLVSVPVSTASPVVSVRGTFFNDASDQLTTSRYWIHVDQKTNVLNPDLLLVNGSPASGAFTVISTQVSGSGTLYILDFTPPGVLTALTVSVPADLLTNLAGAGNALTTDESLTLPPSLIKDLDTPLTPVTSHVFDIELEVSESIVGNALDSTKIESVQVPATETLVSITPLSTTRFRIRLASTDTLDSGLIGPKPEVIRWVKLKAGTAVATTGGALSTEERIAYVRKFVQQRCVFRGNFAAANTAPGFTTPRAQVSVGPESPVTNPVLVTWGDGSATTITPALSTQVSAYRTYAADFLSPFVVTLDSRTPLARISVTSVLHVYSASFTAPTAVLQLAIALPAVDSSHAIWTDLASLTSLEEFSLYGAATAIGWLPATLKRLVVDLPNVSGTYTFNSATATQFTLLRAGYSALALGGLTVNLSAVAAHGIVGLASVTGIANSTAVTRYYDFRSCALNTAALNSILTQCVASNFAAGALRLESQVPAASPTGGEGNADVVTLRARGITVTIG